MNVVETITALRAAGGSVSAVDGSLVVDAPPSLSPAVWDALASHKAVLLELLTPRLTYRELADHEEREAIQAEAQAPADAVAFGKPRPARRCRLLRDVPWECQGLGRVTFPAGLIGTVIDDLGEIENRLERITLSWLLEADRKAGRATLPVFIDGRPRVLEAAAVQVLAEEGDHA